MVRITCDLDYAGLLLTTKGQLCTLACGIAISMEFDKAIMQRIQKVNVMHVFTNVMLVCIKDGYIHIGPDDTDYRGISMTLEEFYKLQRESNSLITYVDERLEHATFHIDEDGFWIAGKWTLDIKHNVIDGCWKWL